MSTSYSLINKDENKKYKFEYSKIKQFVKIVEQNLKQQNIEYDIMTLHSLNRSLIDELQSPEEIEIAHRIGFEKRIEYKLEHTKNLITEKFNTGKYIIEDSNYQTFTLEQFFEMVENGLMKPTQ